MGTEVLSNVAKLSSVILMETHTRKRLPDVGFDRPKSPSVPVDAISLSLQLTRNGINVIAGERNWSSAATNGA